MKTPDHISNYRKEIDGLRALAVIPVIFFHAHFKIFNGGFLGVDIFFVISGFLITGILLRELTEGRYSLLGFYERRARRILPALFFILAFSLPFAWFLLTPDELKQFGASIFSVSIFASNLYFWRNTNYFAPAAEDQPLLHTWSLSVEEQFYLFFPLALMLIWRLWRTGLIAALFIALIFSVSLFELANHYQPEAGFYSLPTRMWELLAGAIVAAHLHRTGSSPQLNPQIRLRNYGLSSLGFILIIFALFFYDITKLPPLVFAICAVLGACLILGFTQATDPIGKLLSSKLFVGIGLASYSIYLWHQPIFAFARSRELAPLSTTYDFVLCALTLVLSALTLKFVEAPFRKKELSRQFIFNGSIAGLTLFSVIGLAAYLNNGFASRLATNDALLLDHYSNYKSDSRRGRCFLSENNYFSAGGFAPECLGTNNPNLTKVYLIGDSHAAAIYKSLFAQLPSSYEITQLTLSGCYPILGNGKIGSIPCQQLSDERFDTIKTSEKDWVLLHANWPSDRFSAEKNTLRPDLIKTINYIAQKITRKNIVLIGCVPTWTPTLPKYLLKKDLLSKHSESDFILNPDYLHRNSCNIALAKLAQEQSITFFNPMNSLCKENRCQYKVKSKKDHDLLTTWDQTHLTNEGAEILVKELLLNLDLIH